jgi:DNA-binding NarL/FixJ family response regulator
MSKNIIKVVLVEDHEDSRASLLALLNGAPDVQARGAGDHRTAMLAMEQDLPDIVVMDIRLPDQDGIQCTRTIKQRWPHVQVMMWTVQEDDDMIFEALRAGAAGYLLKRSPFAEVHASIRMIQDGGSPMSPAIARRVVESLQEVPRKDHPDALTAREQAVLDLMARGLRDKEIASDLSISMNTVRTHVRHIYEKLQVQGRVEAVNKVRGEGRQRRP